MYKSAECNVDMSDRSSVRKVGESVADMIFLSARAAASTVSEFLSKDEPTNRNYFARVRPKLNQVGYFPKVF